MRKFVLTITLVFLCVFLIMLFLGSTNAYLQRKVGFSAILPIKSLYSYNAIDHGKDYNALYVYQFTGFDAQRFTNYACDKQWPQLPISPEVLELRVCEADFDIVMSEMLCVQTGYWYVDDSHRTLCVFDMSEGNIYIRTASVFAKSNPH